MALPASYAFTTDANPLSTSYWTTVITNTNMKALSGVARTANSSSIESGAYWSADSFNDNHYSQIKLTASNAANQWSQKVCVRCQSAAKTFYSFGSDDGTTWLLQKCVSGSWTTIASGFVTHTAAVNDVLYLEVTSANPSVLAWKINTSEHTGTDNSDSTIDSGGAAGILVYYVNSTLDDWAGGNSTSDLSIQVADCFMSEITLGG